MDIHSEEILGHMDEIIQSGSSLSDLPDDLINNLTITVDDPNETPIPDKSMKVDLSQLKVEENRGKEGDDKCNTRVTYKDILNVSSEEILNLVDEILLSDSSLTDLTEDLMDNVWTTKLRRSV